MLTRILSKLYQCWSSALKNLWGGLMARDHRSWCELVIDPLVLNDTRNLRSIIVVMIFIHLLLKLFHMLLRDNFACPITAHLVQILYSTTLLTLDNRSRLYILCLLLRLYLFASDVKIGGAHGTGSLWHGWWRWIHVVIILYYLSTAVETFKLKVRLKKILIHLIIEFLLHFLSKFLMYNGIIRIKQGEHY